MEIVNCNGDMTPHLCADCGGLIIGQYALEMRGGNKVYLHPTRCQKREIGSMLDRASRVPESRVYGFARHLNENIDRLLWGVRTRVGMWLIIIPLGILAVRLAIAIIHHIIAITRHI